MSSDTQRAALARLLLEVHQQPGAHALTRRQPARLFRDMPQILQWAAGRSLGESAPAVACTGADLQLAAKWLVRQTCLRQGADVLTVMGLASGFTRDDLRQHYRLLIRLTHPDFMAAHPGSAPWPEDAAQRINIANDALLRRLGDADTDPGGPEPPPPQAVHAPPPPPAWPRPPSVPPRPRQGSSAAGQRHAGSAWESISPRTKMAGAATGAVLCVVALIWGNGNSSGSRLVARPAAPAIAAPTAVVVTTQAAPAEQPAAQPQPQPQPLPVQAEPLPEKAGGSAPPTLSTRLPESAPLASLSAQLPRVLPPSPTSAPMEPAPSPAPRTSAPAAVQVAVQTVATQAQPRAPAVPQRPAADEPAAKAESALRWWEMSPPETSVALMGSTEPVTAVAPVAPAAPVAPLMRDPPPAVVLAAATRPAAVVPPPDAAPVPPPVVVPSPVPTSLGMADVQGVMSNLLGHLGAGRAHEVVAMVVSGRGNSGDFSQRYREWLGSSRVKGLGVVSMEARPRQDQLWVDGTVELRLTTEEGQADRRFLPFRATFEGEPAKVVLVGLSVRQVQP